MFSWSQKKRVLYISVLVLLALAVIVGVYFIYKPIPSCSDQKQNQDEVGVDCGGVCTLACPNQVMPLTVLWSRIFKVQNGIYDFTALIENKNRDLGVRSLPYTIKIFDKNNLFITERTGETFINPNDKFVIFESGIDLKSRIGVRAFIYFSANPVWIKVANLALKVDSGSVQFTDKPFPKLEAVITNPNLVDFNNIKFYAIVANQEKNVIAVSATLLETIGQKGSQKIYFTWPKPLTEIPLYFDIYPRISAFASE
jgi:hypothetical protein